MEPRDDGVIIYCDKWKKEKVHKTDIFHVSQFHAIIIIIIQLAGAPCLLQKRGWFLTRPPINIYKNFENWFSACFFSAPGFQIPKYWWDPGQPGVFDCLKKIVASNFAGTDDRRWCDDLQSKVEDKGFTISRSGMSFGKYYTFSFYHRFIHANR